ncbi:MAG TPA: CvpA family protein [Prolixibacteraceae bacterium]|nr:CvpA family protein [Prolixibacteraceae bacterium]
MNYIDIIIILLLIFSAIGGISKGLIYEVASLLALILGVWGAIKFSNATESFLVEQFNWHVPHIDIIAFVITLVFIIVIIHILAKAIENALETIQLGALNKIFGMIFAVFKSAFILGILFILVERLDEALPIIPEKPIQESRLYTPLRNVAIYSFPFLKGLYEDIKGTDEDEKDEEEKDEITPKKDKRTHKKDKNDKKDTAAPADDKKSV